MSRKRSLPAADIKWAKLLDCQPPFIHRKKSRGKYAVGVRYERKVQGYLAALADSRPHLRYLEGPWIQFEDQHGLRWCQADGIMLDQQRGVAIVYEVKYRHCLKAWWQLTWLYEPLVRVLFPQYPITGRMEVCHWHDAGVEFPEGYDLTESALRVPSRTRVAVLILNPGRNKRGLPETGCGRGEGSGEGLDPKATPTLTERLAGAA